jgi:hypothetical protein
VQRRRLLLLLLRGLRNLRLVHRNGVHR